MTSSETDAVVQGGKVFEGIQALGGFYVNLVSVW